MRPRRTLLILALLVLGSTPVGAGVLTKSTVTVEYTEPTTVQGGGAITDLTKTSIYYQLPGAAQVKQTDVTASAATGGGLVQQTFSIPVHVRQKKAVTFSATATNPAGESAPLSTVETIDRTPEASAGATR